MSRKEWGDVEERRRELSKPERGRRKRKRKEALRSAPVSFEQSNHAKRTC